MKLRIMTYNIQHGHVHLENHIDLTKVCDVIRAYDPDLVGLNEVRGRGVSRDYTAQAEAMAAYLGYHSYFGRSICLGGADPYGNAVLSKHPIVEASVIRIPDPAADGGSVEPRSLCRCVVEIPEEGRASAYDGPHRKVAVYASHFGLSAAEQEHAVSTALTVLRDEPLPFLLMGDFNMTPDNPLLAPLDRKLKSADAFLAGKKSFPSDAPSQKIDYIYTSPSITILTADIPQVIASDHCPVWADIEVG
ncbi:MAG: endonuclease/exonuclease/phosphatase family protein [Eubacteriales bacterium]